MIKIQGVQMFIQWKVILPFTLGFQRPFSDMVIVNNSLFIIPEIAYGYTIFIEPIKMQMESCCIHDLYLGFTGQICQILFDNSTQRPPSFNLMAIWNSTIQMCYSSTWFFCFPKYFWHYNNHNNAVNFSLLTTRIDSDMLWCLSFYYGNKLPQV